MSMAKTNRKIPILAATVLLAILAFVLILNTVIIPQEKYKRAMALLEAGNFDEAYLLFKEQENYKDASEQMRKIPLRKFQVQLNNANIGDTICFGTYEQDNNTANGKEDIEWLVLAFKDGKALLISKYGLDCQPYNTKYTDVTWETCTLRKWLNADFINTAFTADEKAMIPTVTVSADKNPDYSTDPGKATEDRIFLLSIAEADRYFSSDDARACQPTAYAVAAGAWQSDSGNCWWWLRSPGYYQDYTACVYNFGGVYEGGDSVELSDTAVRPALWIDPES